MGTITLNGVIISETELTSEEKNITRKVDKYISSLSTEEKEIVVDNLLKVMELGRN